MIDIELLLKWLEGKPEYELLLDKIVNGVFDKKFEERYKVGTELFILESSLPISQMFRDIRTAQRIKTLREILKKETAKGNIIVKNDEEIWECPLCEKGVEAGHIIYEIHKSCLDELEKTIQTRIEDAKNELRYYFILKIMHIKELADKEFGNGLKEKLKKADIHLNLTAIYSYIEELKKYYGFKKMEEIAKEVP